MGLRRSLWVIPASLFLVACVGGGDDQDVAPSTSAAFPTTTTTAAAVIATEGPEASGFLDWIESNDTESFDYELVTSRSGVLSRDSATFSLVAADLAGPNDGDIGLSLLGQETADGFEFLLGLADPCGAPHLAGSLVFDSLAEVELTSDVLPTVRAPLGLGATRPPCADGVDELSSLELLLSAPFQIELDPASITLSNGDVSYLFAVRPLGPLNPEPRSLLNQDNPNEVLFLQDWLIDTSNLFERSTAVAVSSTPGTNFEGVSLAISQVSVPTPDSPEELTARYTAVFSDSCGATLRRGRLVDNPEDDRIRFVDAAPGIGFVEANPGCEAEYPSDLDTLLDQPFAFQFDQPIGSLESLGRSTFLTLRLIGDQVAVNFLAPDRPLEPIDESDSTAAEQTSESIAQWIEENGERDAVSGFGDDVLGIRRWVNLATSDDPGQTAITIWSYRFPPDAEQPLGFEDRLEITVHQGGCNLTTTVVTRAEPGQSAGGRLILDNRSEARLVNIPVQPFELIQLTPPPFCEVAPRTEIIELLDDVFTIELNESTSDAGLVLSNTNTRLEFGILR